MCAKKLALTWCGRLTAVAVAFLSVIETGCHESEHPGSFGDVVHWQLESVPRLVIKPTRDGVDPNVVGEVLTSQRQIIIGGAESSRLFLYDSVGTLLRVAAYPALDTNPERYLRWLGRCQGTNLTLAQDIMQREFVFFSEDLRVMRTAVYPKLYAYAHPLECLGNGEIIAVQREPVSVLRSGGDVSTPASLLRLRRLRRGVDSLGTVDTLRDLPPTEFFFAPDVSGYAEQPLGAATLIAAARRRIWVASNSNADVSVLDTAGQPRQHLDLAIRPHQITFSDARESIASRIWDEPSARARVLLASVLAEAPTRTVKLVLDRMIVASDGNVWIRSFERDRPGFRRWYIYGTAGQKVASISVPERLRVMDVGPGYLLGFEPDSASGGRGGVTQLFAIDSVSGSAGIKK